jgi:hypothetical protein
MIGDRAWWTKEFKECGKAHFFNRKVQDQKSPRAVDIKINYKGKPLEGFAEPMSDSKTAGNTNIPGNWRVYFDSIDEGVLSYDPQKGWSGLKDKIMSEMVGQYLIQQFE